MVPPLQAFDAGHTQFAALLEKSVRLQGARSQVNYAWLQQHRGQLNAYLRDLERVPLQEFNAWSQPEQLSFLINAYNAYTLKLILTKYPRLDSIKDLGGWFSGPWDKEFFTLLGEIHNLDALEHQWLRGKYNEPRIHFAIVCASVGCPALSNRPYLAPSLDRQLEQAKMAFLGDSSRNRYDPKTNTLYLSKIFSWFAEDFIHAAGSVENFIAEGITPNKAEQVQIKSQKAKLSFLDYDWSLNRI